MVSDADGSQYQMRAVFDEVTEPERLVWTDQDTEMTRPDRVNGDERDR